MTSHTRTYSWADPEFDPEKIRHLSGLEYLQAIARGELPAAPIGATLGMERPRPEDVQEGRVVFRLKPQNFQYNPIGSVHGGVYATLLDSAVACAIHTTLPAGATYTTLELKVNYIRPLIAGGPEVQAIGQVVHVTRQTGVAEGRIVDDQGRIYAHATTTCLIMRPPRH
ncbi:hotdog fold thioesterase [Deinococcus wulumuqiensis]|uniref:Hotdog fold thioesterase n=1 Tax=Deinococcus wulumuqiensis TaxID=980427 RepID=A0A345IL12_9DEIO|nr:hotdog fold thioesterase [Deinococcus wulumuqiensis]AXH00385.1 hotdog fold thioesterase [Deinococcus wulumuqiensis]QII22169.1 hotdog fold thioesterase [Deinococcus wulumuqiensis R12]GGI81326.1 phenylacetic acid degradation protein [Deinococcus wulumuqiensis]GGP29200.1 phenylacetic acid degradation protein [Deinococcus wulumuqiensis]